MEWYTRYQAPVNHRDYTTWRNGDAVVYMVAENDGQTLLITSDGELMRCDNPIECTPLVKGDHVLYSQYLDGQLTLPDGTTRLPDIKDVNKG